MAGQLRQVAATVKGLFDPGDWISMKPELDPSATLLSLDHTPNPFEVKLQIGIGLSLVTVVAIIVTFLDDGFAIFVACGFGSIGLLNLILGVVRSRFEKSMLFTGHEVIVKTRGLFGRKDWNEPIAGFRGILLREVQFGDQGVGTVTSTKTYHVIELAHPTIGKTLPLYVRQGGEAPRDIQEAFARRFNLPALAPDSGDVTSREAAALDVPFAGQPANDPGSPPSGITLIRQDDSTRITLGQSRFARIVFWLSWLLLLLVIVGVGFMVEPIFGVVAGGMTVFFVLMIRGLGRLTDGRSKDRRPSLVIEPGRIWIDRPTRDDRLGRLAGGIMSSFGGRNLHAVERAQETLLRDVIEQIRVDTYTSHRSASSSGTGHGRSTVHYRLLIESDDGRLTFVGTQFDKKNLEWVRDYLRHELAGDTPPAATRDRRERSVRVG